MQEHAPVAAEVSLQFIEPSTFEFAGHFERPAQSLLWIREPFDGGHPRQAQLNSAPRILDNGPNRSRVEKEPCFGFLNQNDGNNRHLDVGDGRLNLTNASPFTAGIGVSMHEYQVRGRIEH